MIAKNMEALAKGGSAIRALFEEGNRLAALYGRENVFDYSLGNPSLPAPAAVNDAIRSALDEYPSAAVHGYMSNAGYPETRRAVAEDLNRRFGTDFGEDNILMTVGAAGALNTIFKTLLDPGDEVLTVAPYFLEYGNYVSTFGGVLRAVPACGETFLPDIPALAAAMTPRTRALLLNNPNNPTGVIYPRSSLEAVAALLGEKSREYGHPIYLLSDEPYRELAYDGLETPWLTGLYPDTVVAYSWSKSLSLPGERIGYLCIPSSCRDYPLLYDAAVIASRILGYVNAPSLLQRVIPRVLGERADIAAYDRNRRLLYDALTGMGFSCLRPSGAFYLWLRVPDGDDGGFVRRAKAHNLLLVPGASFAGPGYVRLAYCVSEDMIRRSLPAFEMLAKEYNIQ